MNNEIKLVPVYSLKIMMKLVREGFDVIKTIPNREDERFSVFMFKKTPELLAALGNSTNI